MDGEEWNFTALSPEKRELAESLLRRLAARFATGGFLHTGQGKWYPGEPLPRWALGVWWRADGKPLWRDPALIADTRKPGTTSDAEARALAVALATQLGIDAGCVIPAYEDVPRLLVAESALPDNVDPLKADLAKPDERARLARLLQKGLERPAGFVLPIRAVKEEGDAESVWSSSPWPLRRERLYAIEGDSPLGLRLPLASLPEVLPEDEDPEHAVDPFAPRGDLPEVGTAKRRRGAKPAAVAARKVVKTALCVEVRDGHLHVFMPPLPRLEDYLTLLAAVEAAAASTGKRSRHRGLHATARSAGASAERDAGSRRHRSQRASGVVVDRSHRDDGGALRGGARKRGSAPRNSCSTAVTPARAAAITSRSAARRLRTARCCAGPTCCKASSRTGRTIPRCRISSRGCSSARPARPRASTRRATTVSTSSRSRSSRCGRKHTSGKESPSPWLVDRLLRHLLTDLTGNTHRAEFSIDKLYSPDSSTGRLGLLEFRAFEMPPHARMSAVQMLLLRALVARFWQQPYRGALVRWGTALHDRWMLPHFVAADMRRRGGRPCGLRLSVRA